MKGTIILGEGRSGSEWLGGLATSTGCLGKSGEWFAPLTNQLDQKSLSAEEYMAKVLEMASTENGVFLIKVFPNQQFNFHRFYGFDPITALQKAHDVQFLHLERKDLVGQAISYAKAFQTSAWTADRKATKEKPEYDFGEVCRAYFHVRRSNEFWRSYIALSALSVQHFYYEDLLPDGQGFVDALASHAEVGDLPEPEARHEIQRNRETDIWRERFESDLKTENLVPHAVPIRKPYGRLSNYARLAKGDYLKPYPVSF